ncbi:MAG: hypothetical protein Q9221_004690 [Calogaya cf. arnoldii]
MRNQAIRSNNGHVKGFSKISSTWTGEKIGGNTTQRQGLSRIVEDETGKVDPLILNAVVSGTGMHKDGADVSALPSSTSVHVSRGGVSRSVNTEARQIVGSGLLLGRLVPLDDFLSEALDELPDYVQSSSGGSQDMGSVGCSEGLVGPWTIG